MSLPPFKVLEDLVILDISSILAGPTAGSFFAELGAKVIKIENKNTEGDSTRQWKLPIEKKEATISSYYASANTFKEVIMLDLKNKSDQEEFIQIVKNVDIVISNFQKNVAEKLGVTYQHIRIIKEDVIFAQLNAYKYDDPRPGYDLIMQAETGWISMTGSDDEHLAKLPVALIDIIASHQIREAILLALIKKHKTGIGSEIHISLYKAAISALANQASNYLMNGEQPKPLGTLHPNIAPYGDVYMTKDKKQILLAVGSDNQFKKLGNTLNLDQDTISTFELNIVRTSNRNILNDLLRESIKKYDLRTLSQSLSNAKVPFCVINTLKNLFETPLAQEMVISEMLNGVDTKKVSQIAFEFT